MKQRKRIAAFALAAAMVFSTLPMNALAAERPPDTGGLCEHHTEHTADCGYTEGSEGTPCTHEHNGDCYALVTECVHEHTKDCYPAESVSDNTATPSEPDEAEPTECTHECSEESGCITRELDCKHEHDSECGYTPAIEGTPCTYVCEICNPQDDGNAGQKPDGGAQEQCSCITLCAEGNNNPDCPICGAEGADLTACKGKAGQEENCTCTVLCTEDTINTDCPVCGAEGADLIVCKGKAEQEKNCTCTVRCTEDVINSDCPICATEGADLALCLGMLPTVALAAGETDLISALQNGSVEISQDGNYILSNVDISGHHITVKSNVKATLTLNNVSITGSVTTVNDKPESAIDIENNAFLLLQLTDGSSNTLIGGSYQTSSAAPGIHVPENAKLAILGAGSLTVTGGSSNAASGGVGIGGTATPMPSEPGESCGTVVILASGNITITGGKGIDEGSAGVDIGGGNGPPNQDGDDGQGIRPVPGEANTYEVWGELTLPEGVTIPEGAILTGDGSFAEGSKIEQSAPTNAPTASEITDTSVTLNAVTGGKTQVHYAHVKGASDATPPTKDSQWDPKLTIPDLMAATAYTFYARYCETDFYKASPASDGLTVVTAPPPSAVSVNYKTERITFAEQNFEVSSDSNFSDPFQTNESISGCLAVYVRAKVDDGTQAPIRGVTTVSLPPRPNYADGITAVNASTEGVSDGKITGVSSDMEYREENITTWTDCAGNTVENLAPGTYYVRTKATEKSFASIAKEVTIGVGNIITIIPPTFEPVYVGYDQPAPKQITIQNSSNQDVTLTSLSKTAGETFTVQGSGALNSVVPAGQSNTSFTVQPGEGWGVGEHTATITAEYGNGQTASATVRFVVQPRPYDGGGSHDDNRDDNDATVTKRPDADEPNIPTTAQSEKVKTDGRGNVTITKSVVTAAIEVAKADAKKNNNTKNGIAVEVPVEISKDLSDVQITLKADALDKLTASNVKRFTIDTGSMTDFGFTLDTLKELNRQTSGDIVLRIKKTAVSSAEAKAAIGTRPAYDISLWEVKNGKETQITNLNGRTISIAIPYTPAKGEQTGNLYAIYADGSGTPQWITKSSYDTDQKAVIFELTQPGTYGVGYDAKTPAFTDIKNHWAKDNILFVVSRGLLNGTSKTTFSPDTGMTRGMFVTALGRLAGINPDSYQTGKFTDVKADAYYAPYVNWAAQTGIVSGTTDTTFAPDTNINREQMAVILKNYAAKLGYTVPKTLKAVSFADNANISSWAKEAVKSMQQAGILAGKTNNRFDPKGTATRAEVATVLRRFVEVVIDPQTANGWVQNDSGEWSYYKNGEPVKGWLSDGQKWYWLDKTTGKMFAGGWKQIDSKWYYFYTDGAMAVNTTIDGYTIGSDGARKD